MNTIELKNIDERIYHELLPSGLNVYIYSTPNVNNYNLYLLVKTGSIDNNFDVNGKRVTIPNGVEHFLEHLTFNTEDGTAEEFFSKTGAYCNAYTSFDRTVYVASSDSMLKENLEYLLDYVNIPFYNKESVEKERGIITEEALMGENNPYQKMFYKLLESLLIKDNHRNKVIGKLEDIKNISLEDITNTYDAFYQKNNMDLVICGNVDVNEVLDILHKHEDKEECIERDINRYNEEEPDQVNEEKTIMYENVVIPKASIGIKIPKNKINLDKENRLRAISMISSLLFGETSELRLKLQDLNLINEDISYTIISANNHYLLIVDFESENIDKVYELIIEEIDKFKLSESDIERKKKAFISNIIRRFESIDRVTSQIVSQLCEYGKIVDNEYELTKSLNIKELNNVLELIKSSPRTIIELLPKK